MGNVFFISSSWLRLSLFSVVLLGASIKGAYEKGVFPFQFQSAKLCFIKSQRQIGVLETAIICE